MVDRVLLNSNTFVTRDANNNITFSADRYYIKDDPNANFFMGGINSTAVLAAWSSNPVAPYLNNSGWVMSNSSSTVLSPANSYSLYNGPSVSVPINTTLITGGAQNFAAGGNFRILLTAEMMYNGNIINYNYKLNGTTIYSAPVVFMMFVILTYQNGYPEPLYGGVQSMNTYNNLPFNLLINGGNLTVVPSYSSFNQFKANNNYSSFVAGTTYSASSLPQFYQSSISGFNYNPLVAVGSPRNVDLSVTL